MRPGHCAGRRLRRRQQLRYRRSRRACPCRLAESARRGGLFAMTATRASRCSRCGDPKTWRPRSPGRRRAGRSRRRAGRSRSRRSGPRALRSRTPFRGVLCFATGRRRLVTGAVRAPSAFATGVIVAASTRRDFARPKARAVERESHNHATQNFRFCLAPPASVEPYAQLCDDARAAELRAVAERAAVNAAQPFIRLGPHGPARVEAKRPAAAPRRTAQERRAPRWIRPTAGGSDACAVAS